MKYNVGQTIFAMLKKQKQVIPVLVVEELTRKRVDGESFTYTVQLPDDKNTQVQLDKLDADVFDTIDGVKESMLSSAAQTIEKIITRAEKIQSEYFSKRPQRCTSGKFRRRIFRDISVMSTELYQPN